MPKHISKPIEKRYALDRYDDTGETYVVVRQATQDAQEQMSDLFSEVSRIVHPADAYGRPVEVKTRVSQAEVMRRAVWLTLADCNLTIEDDDPAKPPKPVFNFSKAPNGRSYMNVSEVAFLHDCWGVLPPEVAAEIYEKVIDLNVMWTNAGG